MKFLPIKNIVFALIFISACTASKPVQQVATSDADHYAYAKILMAAYQQRAAEYRALCYQAYNIAHLRLDQFINQPSSRPMAIMTDIDETVLDNSPYQVHQSLQGKDYDAVTWHEWTARADADTVPGSLQFFQYAASKNVEIFYVSNRDLSEQQATIKNLRKFGFPNADERHVRLKSSTSSKVERRDSIKMTYNLVMQFGDNLNDFNGAF